MDRRSATFVVRGYRMLTEVEGPFSGDLDEHSWMGAALLSVKENSEAKRAYARAFALDPASTLKEADLGLAYASSGESDVAAEYLEDTLSKDLLNLPVATLLMDIYSKQGDAAKAADLTKRMRAAMKRFSSPWVGRQASASSVEKHFYERSTQLQISRLLRMTKMRAGPGLEPHLRRSDHRRVCAPALPGWAHVWRSALRASHP